MPISENAAHLFKRYLDARQAYSDALGRARILHPGELVIAEVWNEFYNTELERLREQEEEAQRAWEDWLRSR